MVDDFAELEARKIYHILFRQKIPPILLERFSRVSKLLDDQTEPTKLEAYRRLILQVADLEALEMGCRLRRKFGLLSRKFHAMVYLAETLPRNQSFYINESSSFSRFLWEAGLGGVRSLYKALKGVWLCTR